MDHPHNPQRRRFLRTLGLGTAAGAAAAVGHASLAQADGSPSSEDEPPPAARGYRETAHIRAYYDSLRD